MNTHSTSPGMTGPDLLARYLNAYLHARQLSDIERPWGLGSDGLDALWVRLIEALVHDPERLNSLIAEQLTQAERDHIVDTLAPLIFALPLRSYPAELRATRQGPRLLLRLRHIGSPSKKEAPLPKAGVKKKAKEKELLDCVGYLPSALLASLTAYLRRVLAFQADGQHAIATISSGGRRRRVRVTVLARERGLVIRFRERLPSPVEDGL